MWCQRLVIVLAGCALASVEGAAGKAAARTDAGQQWNAPKAVLPEAERGANESWSEAVSRLEGNSGARTLAADGRPLHSDEESAEATSGPEATSERAADPALAAAPPTAVEARVTEAHVSEAALQERVAKRSEYTAWLAEQAAARRAEAWVTAPWEAAWNNSIALCCTIKEQNMTDVREWLQYHKWMGVDHVFIYRHTVDDWLDKNGRSPDFYDAMLQDYVDQGYVSVQHWRGSARANPQAQAYDRCQAMHKADYNWLGMLDIDEFIHVRDKEVGTLKDLLNEYKYFPGLSMHWVEFSSSRLETRPPSGGVLRSYKECTGVAHVASKAIGNTYFISHTQWQHNWKYRGNAQSVNEHHAHLHMPHKVSWQREIADCRAAHDDALAPCAHVREDARMEAAFMAMSDEAATVERVAIFHYRFKSREDWHEKQRQFNAPELVGIGFTRTLESVWEDSAKSSAPHAICQELVPVADKCCRIADTLHLFQKIDEA